MHMNCQEYTKTLTISSREYVTSGRERRQFFGTLDRDHDQFGFEASVQSQLERVNGGELFDREKRAIGRHFTDRGAKTLDVGCGIGRVSCALDARGFDVTGIDISGELIQAAQSHFSGIEFLVSDAATLPFSDNSFEYVIFAYNGIDYLLPEQRRREALREIRRVIRPSGVFISPRIIAGTRSPPFFVIRRL